MTPFEFVFPLFGLLVGLSLTEMLAGLARALKSRRQVRIGWLVPLLGVLVLINLTMFWYGSWQLRGLASLTSASLLMTLLVGGSYYLAASLVFPAAADGVEDFDQHFMATRKLVLAAIAACNVVGLGIVASNARWSMEPIWWIVNSLFLLILSVTAIVRRPSIIAALLVVMIGFHALAVMLGR